MQRMTVLNVPLEYPPGTTHQPGENFDCEYQHVELFKTVGRAMLPDVTQDESTAQPATEPRARRKKATI